MNEKQKQIVIEFIKKTYPITYEEGSPFHCTLCMNREMDKIFKNNIKKKAEYGEKKALTFKSANEYSLKRLPLMLSKKDYLEVQNKIDALWKNFNQYEKMYLNEKLDLF